MKITSNDHKQEVMMKQEEKVVQPNTHREQLSKTMTQVPTKLMESKEAPPVVVKEEPKQNIVS